jgi:hypothetical protein
MRRATNGRQETKKCRGLRGSLDVSDVEMGGESSSWANYHTKRKSVDSRGNHDNVGAEAIANSKALLKINPDAKPIIITGASERATNLAGSSR